MEGTQLRRMGITRRNSHNTQTMKANNRSWNQTEMLTLHWSKMSQERQPEKPG